MRPLAPLLLLAALAGPALAQDVNQRTTIPTGTRDRDTASRPPPPTLVAEPVALFIAGCDANGDGVTTHDELARCVARTFATVDTGHKGTIGYLQYGDWETTWLGSATALPTPFEVDADGDNRITLAELQARFDAIFARLDKARDGKLSRAELLTVRSGLNSDDDEHRPRRRR